MISFENDPRLKNVNPLKLRIIKEIAGSSHGTTVEAMLPEIMRINSELKKRDLSFNKNETDLIMDIMMEQMPAEDRKKISLIRSMM